MDYEKAYKEAVEQAKRELATCGSMDCDAARQIFRFFPELQESEDEKIKKFLIDILSSSSWRREWPFSPVECIAWLEKQKETPKTTDSIPSDYTATAKYLGRTGIWHFTKENDFPDSAREVLCRDAINNYFIGRYYGSGRDWRVSMYDDCDKTNEDNPPVVMWTDIPLVLSSEEMELNDLAYLEQLGYTCIPEGKPVKMETEFEQQVSNLLRSVLNGEHAYNKTFVKYAAKSLLEYAKKEQKPMKWSEEDETILNGILGYLCTHDACELEGFDRWYEWLKSLRSTLEMNIYRDKDYPDLVAIHKRDLEWFDSLYNRGCENSLENQSPKIKCWLSRGCDGLTVYAFRPEKGEDGYYVGHFVGVIDDSFAPDMTREDGPIEVELTIRKI